jgi:hypothetical protein
MGRRQLKRRSPKPPVVAALPIGARAGPQHPSCHGEAIVPNFIDYGAPKFLGIPEFAEDLIQDWSADDGVDGRKPNVPL